MAFYNYLFLNGEALPHPDSYDISMEDVEAESSGETEAGTRQRDVVRSGVHTIAVTFSVTVAWLKKLTAYKQQPKLTVRFFDPEVAEVSEAEMYIEGFKVALKKDTSYGGLWSVSFDLKEL